LLINKNSLDGINLKLFSEETNIDLALKTGENTADIENLEEKHEEVEAVVENLEDRTKWNDQAINELYNKVYSMERKLDDMGTKEEIEEQNNPGIHEEEKKEDDDTDTIIEEVEEGVGVEKGSNLALIIGTLIFGTVSVFLIKMYESRTGGMKE
jgi:predicted RNase H-like nuclease (RuvC/YqgF family)